MTDRPKATEPYTLWFETLPSRDTARLMISPRAGQFHVAVYWNQQYHSDRSFATVEDAESWGTALHSVVMQDALAGALLGYDPDVITRLTESVAQPAARRSGTDRGVTA